MKEKLDFKSNLLIGSLLFGLFFGAGNLIFPVHMGQLAGHNTLQATIGFLTTGVGLPLLGVIASALSQSESLFDMAKPVNRIYSILFTCMLYLTIGPLFAIPRTASVAFEVGLNPFIAKENLQLGLFIFSLIFFAVTLYFSLRPGRILDWIGKYLTPIFIGLLSILVMATFLKPMGQASQYAAQGDYIHKPFFKGLLEGYNTMDALASLAFAIANFGLSKIIQLSIPVLMFLYPLAITLIILSLLSPILNKQRYVYKWTTILTAVAAFFDLCNALPKTIKESTIISSIISFAKAYLPGFTYGFGWIIPALIGFMIGIFLWRVQIKYNPKA